ncbi:DNA fragmentation factor subunit alpha [Mus caroli]|uniref:DNAation factor subunit alpha n=1 Tax=Mus caroli TaxID=10089 RepID=A0A6P7R3Q2_MUSCR|nr:DNA fragmentation factor subunit alpha [Mus caroli]
MELSRGASAPDPDDVRPLKPCLLRRNHSRDQHGVAASSLEELRSKACELLAIDKSLTPITLVLAEDGTIVDDDDYFLCLPSNTKFVALACNEKWTYNDSGKKCWLRSQERASSRAYAGQWLLFVWPSKHLHSKGYLNISACQVLIDIPCAELAQELCQSCATVQGLQSTLQQVLDQREEARQSKQLLELYLQALEKEGNILSNQKESKAALSEELDAVDTGVGREMASEVLLRSQILTTLKEKPVPELSLSSQDLESVSKEDPKALAVALSWDIRKAETVQQACTTELALRLQQVQSLHSLRNLSARRSPLPGEPQRPKRAKRDSS